MSDNLPYDILENIFSRFSARSLVRFSFVCKQWRSYIFDPKFVLKHTNRLLLDLSNGPPKVIIHRIVTDNDSSKNSVILKSIDLETLNSTNFELKFQALIIPVIVGFCNGLCLLSLRCKDDALVLWNPLLTGKYDRKYLPESNFVSGYTTYFDGFGYAPSIDDYKVIRLCRKMYGYLPGYSDLEVEVYSLKTDSWKIIPGVPATDIKLKSLNYMTTREGTHVGESIYWTFQNINNLAVLVFDLITEKFRVIQLSGWNSDNDVGRDSTINLVQVRGFLGAYWSGRCGESTVIWKWNEDENELGYLTILLTIPSQYANSIRVLSFRNDNEVLLHVKDHVIRKLVIYDAACMISRDLPCGNVVGWPIHMVETLVSPLSC